MKHQAQAKEAAGRAAAHLIQSGMKVGLGTGTTVEFFIKELGKRCSEGLNIHGVASSKQSAKLAEQHQIPLLDEAGFTTLDITVDGADQIDPLKRMIKGGGGALLREKVIAFASREMIVIADDTKRVTRFTCPLPIEIAEFGQNATIHRLKLLGYEGKKRDKLSDNGNVLFDIYFPDPIDTPEAHDRIIRGIPGVLETGFFFNLAGRIIIGKADGSVEILP